MTKREPVTIADIAEAAGVSITTVSHALSGKGRLPAATRKRVSSIARDLGYRPNRHARGLATGLAMTIGMQLAGAGQDEVVPDFTYFVELLNAASAEALGHGYGLIVVSDEADASLRQLPMDGAIIVDPTGQEPLLHREDLPLVTTGRVPGGDTRWPSVDNDHRLGARLVFEHFGEVGCERPALLTTRPGQSYVDDTVAEYESWCTDHSLEPLVARIAGVPTERAAEPAALELLQRRPRPDAIYATLDRAAVGVLFAARTLGLRVPDDIAVAAVTDSPVLAAVDPPVTALNLNSAEIGREAVRILLQEIGAGRAQTGVTIIPTELVRRASTVPHGTAGLRTDGSATH